MFMKYFGMPSDFKKETIDQYVGLHERYPDSRVIETYGQITLNNSFASGRTLAALPQVDIDLLKEYISYSHSKGIEFNYTVNASFMANMEFTREGINEIKVFMNKLHDAGVRWLTITMPSLIELVDSLKNKFHIKASTICQIDNANKALWYKNLGVERIVLAESINRDFQKIKSISKAFGDKVEIIVNSVCHRNCIYRISHYNENSISSLKLYRDPEANMSFFVNRCALRRYSDISNYVKLGWVRPEDLKYYVEAGVRYFKLQGRHLVNQGGNPVLTLEHYMKESYDGNLLQLFDMFSPQKSLDTYIDNRSLDGFVEAFYNTPGFCREDCTSCSYCESFAKKCIDYKKAQKDAAMAELIFNRGDQYKNLLKEAAKDN